MGNDIVLRAMQKLVDDTFKDRNYSGGYKPVKLRVVDAHRISNARAERDYNACKTKFQQNKTGSTHPLQEDVMTRQPCQSAILQELLGTDIDASIGECILFHGTSPGAAKSIANDDFHLPRSHKHGGIYGKGIYLAESSTKAHMYTTAGSKGVPILVVRAVLGDVKVLTDDKPNVTQIEADINSKTYTSVCGDRRSLKFNFSGWREFIVYDNEQALTEWIIWCIPK